VPTALRDLAIGGAAWTALAILVAASHPPAQASQRPWTRPLHAPHENDPERNRRDRHDRTDADDIAPDWEPDPALVKTIADRVTEQYGKHARLNEIGLLALAGDIPEVVEYDDGQIEEFFDEVRDELAVRDNGNRR
jgi:hypothetical protein